MAQNPQPNSNSANYSYLYSNQYYYNLYTSQQNPITPGKVNTNTPPPPGVSNYTSQLSPSGISNFTLQLSPPGTIPPLQSQQNYNYQYYNQFQNPYYYQPPPPGYPNVNSVNPLSNINTNTTNTTANSINKEQIQNKPNQNSFKPSYIPVQPEKLKINKDDNNSDNNEMAKKKGESNNGSYPQSLKDYIIRMYKECPKDKIDILDNELKRLIDDAILRKALYTIEWEKMELPTSCRVSNSMEDLNQQVLSNDLLLNNGSKKKRKKSSDSSSSSTLYSSQMSSSSTVIMDESLMKLPENERIIEIKRREMRNKRFKNDLSAEKKKRQEKEALNRQAELTKQMYIEQNGDPNVVDWDTDTLIGTCQDLEKNYMRLTSAPDPSTVRPLPVLRKTLELLKQKWTEEQNYSYICDQFKSLRQDLTVQRIKNDFAVEVYEIHARIALEKGDLGEYNQCQSQLKQLYKLGFKGHEIEFTAYRLLYYLHTLNPKDINTLISELSPEQKKHEFIKHALEVRSAVANGNYHKLFYLYLNPPHNMACYLMDHFVERERIKALKVMTKAYLTLSITFITDELGFDSEEDCIELLNSVRCPIRKNKNKEYIINGKETHQIFLKKWQELAEKGIDIKGQI